MSSLTVGAAYSVEMNLAAGTGCAFKVDKFVAATVAASYETGSMAYIKTGVAVPEFI